MEVLDARERGRHLTLVVGDALCGDVERDVGPVAGPVAQIVVAVAGVHLARQVVLEIDAVVTTAGRDARRRVDVADGARDDEQLVGVRTR